MLSAGRTFWTKVELVLTMLFFGFLDFLPTSLPFVCTRAGLFWPKAGARSSRSGSEVHSGLLNLDMLLLLRLSGWSLLLSAWLEASSVLVGVSGRKLLIVFEARDFVPITKESFVPDVGGRARVSRGFVGCEFAASA